MVLVNLLIQMLSLCRCFNLKCVKNQVQMYRKTPEIGWTIEWPPAKVLIDYAEIVFGVWKRQNSINAIWKSFKMLWFGTNLRCIPYGAYGHVVV